MSPEYVESYNNLGNVLQLQNAYQDAVENYRKAIKINPDYAESHSNLGNALRHLGNNEEAIAHYNKAINIKPDFAMAHYNLGNVLVQLGQKEDAIKAFETAIELRHAYAEAHRHLSMLKYENSQITAIDRELLQTDLPQSEKMHFHYALGNIHNENKDYDQAFEHYLLANNLKRRTLNYDAAQYTSHVNTLIDGFTPDYFRKVEGYGSESILPVFIVGMPRSGTTLVEQILSSHPEISGAGELTDMLKIEKAIIYETPKGMSYAKYMSNCDATLFRNYSQQYLQVLEKYSNKALRVTDKDPGNFHRIGLIKSLFPKARIIHCQRNPLDTCTSIFFNYFIKGNEYTFDLEELGKYYLDYQRLMTHWNKLFPEDILNIQYESLVNQQLEYSQKIIAHTGLPWNEKCLEFHLNDRAVKTLSCVQVRQPIYSQSIDRWKRYENHLQPLMEILKTSRDY